MIESIIIENFKCFEGRFNLSLNEGVNVIVGKNEAGKSTILEAIHLALTGQFRGRLLKGNISQYLFNSKVVNDYISSVQNGTPKEAPYILIELYLNKLHPEFEGDMFSSKDVQSKASGIGFKICLDNRYLEEYNALVKTNNIISLPVEYYDVEWYSFARKNLTGRSVPIKSSYIDAGLSKFQNGSDLYISRIIKNVLEVEDQIKVSQAYRGVKDTFSQDQSIVDINGKLGNVMKISTKSINLGVDLGNKSSWDGSLTTLLDDIPFEYVGKGEQAIVKTDLSLSSDRTSKSSVVLIEEPECHISHVKLNQLIRSISDNYSEKQIILSTHSSFVSNKLGLDNLILLHEQNSVHFRNIESKEFFNKLPGYDTLRFILCKKAILVEGDSDELIIQRAYKDRYCCLPIEDEVEVISVGTAFLRFLEIAEKLKTLKVIVVTDNDGKIDRLEKKYGKYLNNSSFKNIKICFDSEQYEGNLQLGRNKDKPFNYNTLEPSLVRANNWHIISEILGKKFSKEDDLHEYMNKYKTDCALSIFSSKEKINYPDYITKAIEKDIIKDSNQEDSVMDK